MKSTPFPKNDILVDCRGIANPHHVPLLSHLTGDDPLVQKWVREKTMVYAYTSLVYESISRLPIRRKGEDPLSRQFDVLCACAYGVHRSRAMKHILAEELRGLGFTKVEVQ